MEHRFLEVFSGHHSFKCDPRSMRTSSLSKPQSSSRRLHDSFAVCSEPPTIDGSVPAERVSHSAIRGEYPSPNDWGQKITAYSRQILGSPSYRRFLSFLCYGIRRGIVAVINSRSSLRRIDIWLVPRVSGPSFLTFKFA